MQTLFQCFDFVIWFPSPLVGYRHATFPGPIILETTNTLFGCIKITLGSSAVIDDDIGLNGMGKIYYPLTTDCIESLGNIEPKHEKWTIVQQ